MTRSQIDNIDCHFMLKEKIKNQKMPFCTMGNQFFGEIPMYDSSFK